jgi:SAM-dependent methyltransferase
MPASTAGAVPTYGLPRGTMNLGAYLRKSVVSNYAASSALMPAEQAALALAGSAPQGDVLDIGVGTGRNTRYVRPRVRRYVAIAFSAAMVTECRARHPDVHVSVGDARDLRRFADGEFDFALFSYNGNDYVEPAEREAVLVGIRRILRVDGLFVYSSHNVLALGGRLPDLDLEQPEATLNPLAMGWRWGGCQMRNAGRRRNRARVGAGRFLGPHLARVSDSAVDHAFLTV